MIARLVPRGLRGRLLAAFVVTSMLTLIVAAAVLYGPLQSKLRSQSVDNLRDAVVNARGAFTQALGPVIKPPEHGKSTDEAARPEVETRRAKIGDAAFDLRQRIDWKAAGDFNRFYYALVERVAGQDAAPAWKAGSSLRQ